MSLTQYGLAFRIEVGWVDGIFAFDANLSEERLRNYTRPPVEETCIRVGKEFLNAGQADAIDSGKIGTESYE
jgi:hypothetical protein